MTNVYRLRAGLREAMAENARVIGTFVKLASLDIVDLALAAGLDFVVVDLEHSTLQEADAIALVRHADAVGLAALVRLPSLDASLVARLLENGAVGIQLSTVRCSAQTQGLVRSTRFAPEGRRSISLANRVAAYGGCSIAEVLIAERDQPPLLIGQIETMVVEPLAFVVTGLDVAFVGSTDLAVSLELLDDSDGLRRAVRGIENGARSAKVGFGGWASSVAAAGDLGLGTARYLVVGSDQQLLGSSLKALRLGEHPPPRPSTTDMSQGSAL